MESDDSIIIQVIFKFEDGRLYNFDVDSSTTFYETKKIISNATHILKNYITFYHEGQEFSSDYDDQPLKSIFPKLKKIEFNLKIRKSQEEQDENENDQISVKYNINQPCKEHIGKFLVLYCISCKTSICNECFSISHNEHEVEEKADYLMPAKVLMERIFAKSFMFKSDPKISNYMSCVNFRSIIKTEIFDKMRNLINDLENKCINCLEFFSLNEDYTEKNNDLNLELLKKYCTTSFIKLKNNIDTKQILINDEVFLFLYNKLKSIKDYKLSLFNQNINKYKNLNELFLPFTQEIKNMSIDLNNTLMSYINKDIYAKFKEEVSKNTIDIVQKEDVIRFMFENIYASKSALKRPEEKYNKNSHTPNLQRTLPSKLLFNEIKNNNICKNFTNISNNNISDIQNIKNNINFNDNSIPNISNNIENQADIKHINQNNIYQHSKQNFSFSKQIHFSLSSKNIINNNNKINSSNNNNIYSNMNNVDMNFSNVSKINTLNSNSNNNMSLLESQSLSKNNCKISSSQNYINNKINGIYLLEQNNSEYTQETSIDKEEKIKPEKMELEESEETYPTKNSPDKSNEIKNNLINNNNLYKSPFPRKTLIDVHFSPIRKINNMENKNENYSKSFIMQKNYFFQNYPSDKNNLEIPTNSKGKIEESSPKNKNISMKNTSNNICEKFIDVLNREINNSITRESKSQKKNDHSLPSESSNFSKEIISNEKNMNTKENFINSNDNSTSNKIDNNKHISDLVTQNKHSVLFMYPVFKSNIIKCGLDKNIVHEIKISFEEFSKSGPIITEFPNGGAYCHYEKFLFYSGGQENVKEAGKIFLSIVKKDTNQTAVKLPSMKNSHFNHSMIANKDKIYVIGGYNSNKCEVYDIINKTWNEMPDLIAKERQKSMLEIQNNYLYSFMGLSQNGILDSVERINLDNIEVGWESINIDSNEDINLKFYGAGIIEMNTCHKILFIGGKTENENKDKIFKRSIYEFSFDDNKMVVSDFKIENDLLFVENKLYPIEDNDYGNFINIDNGYLISMPNLLK